MGKCLTSMNCNDNETTKYFDTTLNPIEYKDENKQKTYSKNLEINTNEIIYPQIVLSIGNMLVSPATYSYMFKNNSNLEDFIDNKLKGISINNQFLISKFMFENIKLKENMPFNNSGHEIIANTIQSLHSTFSDLMVILPLDNNKHGLNKIILNIVFHLTEIHHYINYLSILLNQKRDEYYNRNYWVNIENICEYFNIKIADCSQSLQNIKKIKFLEDIKKILKLNYTLSN